MASYSKKKTIFGGNSGYQGYSMSNRAVQAYENGKLTYTKLPTWAKRMVDAGLASSREWHHTSSYGNKTIFYDVQQFFDQLSESEKEKFKVEELESFKDVPKEIIKQLEENAKQILKKKNNIKEVRKFYIDEATKKINDFNANFKTFSREKLIPKYGIYSISEMNGKYGWFPSSSRYSLPEYYSGIDYETEENKNRALELNMQLAKAEIEPIYKIELQKKGLNRYQINLLNEIGIINSEIMPESFYLIVDNNKDIIINQLNELLLLPKVNQYFYPLFDDNPDNYLTDEEKKARDARHDYISIQGENFGSSYERRVAHEENDKHYKFIASERINEAKQDYLRSDEIKKEEEKFNQDKLKAIDIIGNLKYLFEIDNNDNKNVKYRKGGELNKPKNINKDGNKYQTAESERDFKKSETATKKVRYNGTDSITSIGRSQSDKDDARRIAKEKVKNPETNESLKSGEAYVKSVGIPKISHHNYVKSNASLQTEIAELYPKLIGVDSPNYKETQLEKNIYKGYKAKFPTIIKDYKIKNYKDLVEKSYAQLIYEIDKQYYQLPIHITYHDGDNNYENSADMMDDVHNFGHLWVFKGGDDHPKLGSITKDKNDLTANEKFRAVHDYYGHSVEGYQFGKDGEENAWIEHSKMLSPLAQWALSTETRGQNSWVNYSGINKDVLETIAIGSKLKKQGLADGNSKMIEEGQSLLDTVYDVFVFAEQKSIILPVEYTDNSMLGGNTLKNVPEKLDISNRYERGGELNKPKNINMLHRKHLSLNQIENIDLADKIIIKESLFELSPNGHHYSGDRYITGKIISPLNYISDSYLIEVEECHCHKPSQEILKGTVINRTRKHLYLNGKLVSKAEMGTTLATFEHGGINPDSKDVKDYFSHNSGEAGGLLIGNRHSEGGIKAEVHSTGHYIEMEGGEAVITRGAVASNKKYEYEGKQMTTREILSDLNVKGGGVSFAEGGDIPEKIKCACNSFNLGGIPYSVNDFVRLSEKDYETQRLIDGIEKERKDHFYTLAKLNAGAITIEQALKEIAVKEMMIDRKYPY